MHRASQAADHAVLLGVKIDNLAPETLVDEILSAVASGSRLIAASVNAHALNLAFERPWLRVFLNQCEIVFCDGFGVKWAAALVGQAIQHRMSPPDWIDLLADASAERATWFLLGGSQGVAELASRRLVAKHPGLRIVGFTHGYFDKGPTSTENKSVVAMINASRPDILIVGMGMPLQEQWLADNWESLGARVAITAGALIDYLAGAKTRPPKILTDHGLEWAARILHEPGRLWRRYLVGNPVFLWRVLRQKWGLLKFDTPPRPER